MLPGSALPVPALRPSLQGPPLYHFIFLPPFPYEHAHPGGQMCQKNRKTAFYVGSLCAIYEVLAGKN